MHILAMSSGLSQKTPATRLIQAYLFSLVAERQPRVAFLPTAVGDAAEALDDFYATFEASDCEPSHLALFDRTIEDLRSYLLAQHVIFVSGGNTANLLAVWRTHGLDEIMLEAWQQGVVLCGYSAGGLCWFEAGVTDSFGPTLAPLTNGLGFLTGSFCPHYDSELSRRPTFHQFVADGLLPGWACEDGTALHFRGTELVEVVSSVPAAKAFRVERGNDGIRETAVELRLLH